MLKTRGSRILFTLFLFIVSLAACTGQDTYQETFDAPGSWSAGNDGDAIGEVKEGVYDLFVQADDIIIWTTAVQSFSDGIYEVEATPVEGTVNNGYGMMFRTNNETDDFYLFKVSGDGFVWIGLCKAGCTEETPLVTEWWFESTAVKKGNNVTNKLKVQAEGANMIFYVNDVEVGRFTDPTLRSGDIGLLVQTLGQGGVRVQFDNFTVSPLDQ